MKDEPQFWTGFPQINILKPYILINIPLAFKWSLYPAACLHVAGQCASIWHWEHHSHPHTQLTATPRSDPLSTQAIRPHLGLGHHCHSVLRVMDAFCVWPRWRKKVEFDMRDILVTLSIADLHLYPWNDQLSMENVSSVECTNWILK